MNTTDKLADLLKEARKIIRASSSRNLAKDWDARSTAALAANEAAAQAPAAPAPEAQRSDGMPASADERHLRRLLAARVGMPQTYFDDGEAQGAEHGISIDFMREPVAHLDAKLRALNVARYEVAKAAPPAQAAGQAERAAFEAHYRIRWEGDVPSVLGWRSDAGQYVWPATNEAWNVWKARAALAATPAPAPQLPQFIRVEVERAIEAAKNPKGMSIHDGKAVIGHDKLAYMLAVIDRLAATPAAQAPAAPAGEARLEAQGAAEGDALSIAREALDEIALAGMSGSGQESEEGMRAWHARQAWRFIGIAARAIDKLKVRAALESKAQPKGTAEAVPSRSVQKRLAAQHPTQGAEPSPGLLMSMAIRYDHALGLPGYYDSNLFKSSGVTHAQRLESTLRTMRQLWEEATGRGFYSPEREADYVKLASGGEVQHG